MDFEKYRHGYSNKMAKYDGMCEWENETDPLEDRHHEGHSKNDKKSKYRKLFLQRARLKLRKLQNDEPTIKSIFPNDESDRASDFSAVKLNYFDFTSF
jgi:hypothetical protein